MTLNAFDNSLHTLSAALRIPVIILLLVFAALVIIEAGSVIAEAAADRKGKKTDAASLLRAMQEAEPDDIKGIITGAGLINRQKKALLKLWEYRDLDVSAGQALAAQILAQHEQRLERIVSASDIIVKLGPMLGLMGTLIPLGPGLIALGQGDIQSLANSLVSAFDTTVAGLATAGVAFVISKIRKLWYEKDMTMLESLVNGLLSVMYDGGNMQHGCGGESDE